MKKQAWMNRVIYLVFLIGAAIFVSWRGGAVPYLLFYFALLLPVLALLYSVYVYASFRISQEVLRRVTKAEEIPYQLVMANENVIPFINITLNFFSDMVTIQEGGTKDLCILSHQEIKVDTEMRCKYRGTYPVGVKSVEVTDFLGLFTITYPLKEQMRVTARPRIIPIEQLKIDLQQKDPKSNHFSACKLQNLPDYELRKYAAGDSLKYIHWKNSARSGELLVRKRQQEELFENVLIMDLSPLEGDAFVCLQTEDNIIEASISLIYDYYMKNISVRVVYMQDEIKEVLVDKSTGFDPFFNLCADLAFSARQPLSNVFMEYCRRINLECAFILVTSRVNDSLRTCVEAKRMYGSEILVIATGELPL